jgi:hypothetical protein
MSGKLTAWLTGGSRYGSLRAEGQGITREASMSRRPFITIAALVALLFATAAQTASLAQDAQPGRPYPPRARQVRPRIVITPRPLLYRRCVDWLELQYRPSGTVLFPQYKCWWVRG